jgi:hypothetical protein
MNRLHLGSWKWQFLVIGLTVIGALWFLIYGSTDEPVYHGRTVTQWLDHMALFDEMRRMDKSEEHSYRIPNKPEIVTNDPALRALLAIGPKAVPTLEKRLTEPPHRPNPKSLQEIENWLIGKWGQLQGAAPPPSPPGYGDSFQLARKAAAGLGLLALGTNNNAGALRLIEIAAVMQSRGYRNSPDISDSFRVAGSGLPERYAETVAGIVQGLNHTNAQYQATACSATQSFRTNLPVWKNKLIQIALGPPGDSSQWALWSLACADAKDRQVMELCEKVVQDNTKPLCIREFAAAGLGMAGENASNALPLLQAVSVEQGTMRPASSNPARLVSNNTRLQSDAREAIARIKKAIEATNASSPKQN